jgi:hypothetical protein
MRLPFPRKKSARITYLFQNYEEICLQSCEFFGNESLALTEIRGCTACITIQSLSWALWLSVVPVYRYFLYFYTASKIFGT